MSFTASGGTSKAFSQCTLGGGHQQAGCSDPLGMASGHIPDNKITASSRYMDDHYASYHGRLYNRVTGMGAWTARIKNIGEWLEVDLREVNEVTGTVIQGQYNSDHWVTSYKLNYSGDGNSWTTYKDSDGSEKVFSGNTDDYTPVTNLLDYPIDARYVRFVVQSWNNRISMRGEILGCNCPIGDYVRFKGVCYKSFTDTKTRDGAKQECSADGGMLAMPKDSVLNDFLYYLTPRDSGRWIGLTDANSDGEWVFEDGQALMSSNYSNWYPGEPKPYNGRSGCAVYGSEAAYWTEKNCNLTSKGFVCQLKAGSEIRQYTNLGCWRESFFVRTIPSLERTDPRLTGHHRDRHNPIKKCYQVTLSRGYSVFGVMDGGECRSSADAHNTYNKHGPSTECEPEGEGAEGKLAPTNPKCLSERSTCNPSYLRGAMFERNMQLHPQQGRGAVLG
ncbi:hypothetical protein Bbelb_054970 [Branchiostoma belcheri]|nr:hypothetical protein Bbelb_054970 [Branchiostoma belcheri]